MTDDRRRDEKEFQSFCQGLPFEDMIKKMMRAEKGGLPCNCVGMMSQMMKISCGAGEKEEGTFQETKENPAPNA